MRFIRPVCQALSCIGYGVFFAPFFIFVWLVLPVLRNFPIGDDSPSIGAFIGFCVGVCVGVRLVRQARHWRWSLWGGGIGFVALVLAGIWIQSNSADWDHDWGLVSLFAWIIWLFAAVSVAGLLAAGVFGWAGGEPTRV